MVSRARSAPARSAGSFGRGTGGECCSRRCRLRACRWCCRRSLLRVRRSCRGTSGSAPILGRIGTALGSAAESRARRWRPGRAISRSVGNSFTTERDSRASAKWGGVSRSRRGRGNHRGAARGTCIRCFTSTRRETSRSPGATSDTWRGLVGSTASGSSVRSAARACGSCLATGRRRTCRATSFVARASKATLQENARNPHLPRMLIWVSPTLTRPTGVTMRNLRRCRQLWAVRMGLLPPPSWSGVELAQVVALAGPWPARGP